MAQIISFRLKRRLLQVRTDCSGGHQSAAIVTPGCVIAVLFFIFFSPASVCGWVALSGSLHVTLA